MRGVLLVIFFESFCSPIWSQVGERTYKAELLGKIPIGKDKGELGYWIGPGIANSPSSPMIHHSRIYIMDTANGRLNIYSLDLKFLEERILHNTGTDISHSYYFSILPDESIIGISSIDASRVDKSGVAVYRIPAEKLPRHVWSYGWFWTYEDFLVFALNRDGGPYQAIDGNGNLLGSEDLVKLSDRMRESSKVRKESQKIRSAIDQFLKENGLLLSGDLLLTWDANLNLRYLQVIKDNIDRSISDRVVDSKYSSKGGSVGFFSDDRGNRQWFLTNEKAKRQYRYIISPLGEVLDFFNISPDGRIWEGGSELLFKYGFASDGNLYSCVLNMSNNSFDFYKVTSRW